MNSKLLPLWALTLLLLASCKKDIVPVASPGNAPETINKVNVVNIDYNYLSAKGNVQLESQNLSANVTMRLKRDEMIWATVSKLGIEAVRLKITPDSVYMINRLKQEYFAGSYALLQQKYKIDVNFKELQDILVGNFVPGDPAKEKYMEMGPIQHVRQLRNNLQVDQFVDTTRYKLKRIEVRNLTNKDLMTMDYQEFDKVNGKPFPMALLLTIQQPEGNAAKTTVVAVKHKQVSVSETSLDFPFSVPSDYERK
ncbi:DUF4292 domain-containing protein [Nibribacter ruber]|uniref:DUF4292 domain-containing protein n=1 Tax=Nibribacter ruber TaxID=2698458 RepID=A0A6P1P1C5_9BACT|nr:lipoprotein insertase outer membrane protein LolB [Nibribacter ruber]QHL88381.1 DUF4292 domain-containing protein [Nibribacter ruber]